MKISFSTIGCPNWSLKEMLSVAKDFGYNGIELRGVEHELYLPRCKDFQPEKLTKTLEDFDRLALEIPCLTTGVDLHNKGIDYRREITDYINLAKDLGAPYIRVMGESKPHHEGEVDIALVTARLKEMGEVAAENGVTLLLETNGIFADSKVMKKVMEEIGGKGVGVLWDVHHPYRFYREEMTYTYEMLAPYIRHVHFKDSVLRDDGIHYQFCGDGDLPLTECLQVLKKGGYDGFISLEWVKLWRRELEESGIVFMQYADYMRAELKKLS